MILGVIQMNFFSLKIFFLKKLHKNCVGNHVLTWIFLILFFKIFGYGLGIIAFYTNLKRWNLIGLFKFDYKICLYGSNSLKGHWCTI